MTALEVVACPTCHKEIEISGRCVAWCSDKHKTRVMEPLRAPEAAEPTDEIVTET